GGEFLQYCKPARRPGPWWTRPSGCPPLRTNEASRPTATNWILNASIKFDYARARYLLVRGHEHDGDERVGRGWSDAKLRSCHKNACVWPEKKAFPSHLNGPVRPQFSGRGCNHSANASAAESVS